MSLADPWSQNAGLSTGVAQLDASLGSLAVYELDDALQRGDMLVGPQPGVLGADAAASLDGSGLDYGEGGAGLGELAEVDEMVVREDAVLGAVLAHGRDDEAVVQCRAPDLQGLEESGC